MKKILIVDDDPITLKLVEQYLSSQGYNTITAMDGFDAMARDGAPDHPVDRPEEHREGEEKIGRRMDRRHAAGHG